MNSLYADGVDRAPFFGSRFLAALQIAGVESGVTCNHPSDFAMPDVFTLIVS
jgi:hypothetical protein